MYDVQLLASVVHSNMMLQGMTQMTLQVGCCVGGGWRSAAGLLPCMRSWVVLRESAAADGGAF
jgi:hypothetical protein